MKIKLLIFFLTTIFTSNIIAQSTEDLHNHEHHKNEIGVANSLVFFVQEEVFAYGLHIHYVRNIPKSKFGLGLGYERIFDEHGHNGLGLVAAYRPVEHLNFVVSPGLSFEDGEQQVSFALHLETSYEFEIKNFHVGPALEFAYDHKDIHISIGIHIGYGF